MSASPGAPSGTSVTVGGVNCIIRGRSHELRNSLRSLGACEGYFHITVEINLTDTDPTSPQTPTLSDVFDALQEAARTAAATGHVLYGPRAKRVLTLAYPDFTVRAFGYKKFIELLRAGHDAGRFELVTVDGHPHIVPAAAVSEKRPIEQGWLRADLWTTLVTWDTGMRYWDRRNRRAIFVPTNEARTPLWDVTPEKFVKIDAVPMQRQLEWMVDFANDQTETKQHVLLEALKDPAPGAFKRALGTVSLGGAWRTRLREKVTEHALEWAAEAKLPPTAILEMAPRTPTARPVSPTPSPAPRASAGGDTDSETAQLRARLHAVIDKMGLGELSQIQVPAAYLLEP